MSKYHTLWTHQQLVESLGFTGDLAQYEDNHCLRGCNLKADQAKAERVAWWEQHPYACTGCEGAGEFREPDSYDTPGFAGPCECVEDGRCPLCGKIGTLINIETNPSCSDKNCGWTGKRQGDVAPDGSFCCGLCDYLSGSDMEAL